jgi:hypothetical protein
MLIRTIGAGLTLAAVALTTGCCHHKQTCCAPPVSKAPCCPPGGTAVPATAVPVPIQTYSSPPVYPSYPQAPAGSH